jgi:hypothetical protein
MEQRENVCERGDSKRGRPRPGSWHRLEDNEIEKKNARQFSSFVKKKWIKT